MVYSPKPRSDVFCFKLNFKISKLGYCFSSEGFLLQAIKYLQRFNSELFIDYCHMQCFVDK